MWSLVLYVISNTLKLTFLYYVCFVYYLFNRYNVYTVPFVLIPPVTRVLTPCQTLKLILPGPIGITLPLLNSFLNVYSLKLLIHGSL